MTDNVLPFRRSVQPIVWSDGRVQNECDDLVHLFESIPGRCQCGERLWESTPAEDGGSHRKETEPSVPSP